MVSGNINIQVSSFTFPPAVLDFSSLERVRKSVRERLKKCGFLILDEKLVGEEEVRNFISFFGVKRLSALVDVYRDENGFIYREYLLVNPKHLVSMEWIRVLGVFLVEVIGGIYKGFDVTGKLKCGLVLSLQGFKKGRVMCMAHSESIYRDVLNFVNEGGFSDRLEYERVSRPGEVRERVVEVGVPEDDVWVRFFRLGGNRYGLELMKRIGG